MQFTIITGLSGAGRSTALKTMEDMGCFCADNIPPTLIPRFAELCLTRQDVPEHVAIVADLRMGELFNSIYKAIDELRDMPLGLDILFLDASDDILISRFKQTRRRHPVSGSGKIIAGILAEREQLQRMKELADSVIDTSTYSVRSFSSALERIYSEDRDNRLLISVITFGYKRGIPMDADLVFDVRFLPNPFYMKELRSFSGLNENVRNYVLGFEAGQVFLDKLEDMIKYLAPCYLSQDKKQLVIAIGCTGGMHRSVAIGEELHSRLISNELRATIEHRDLYLEKDSLTKRFLKAVKIDD